MGTLIFRRNGGSGETSDCLRNYQFFTKYFAIFSPGYQDFDFHRKSNATWQKPTRNHLEILEKERFSGFFVEIKESDCIYSKQLIIANRHWWNITDISTKLIWHYQVNMVRKIYKLKQKARRKFLAIFAFLTYWKIEYWKITLLNELGKGQHRQI